MTGMHKGVVSMAEVLKYQKYVCSSFGNFADKFMPSIFTWALRNWFIMNRGEEKLPSGHIGVLTVVKKGGGMISFLLSNVESVKPKFEINPTGVRMRMKRALKVQDKRMVISFSSTSSIIDEAIEGALFSLLFIIEQGRVKTDDEIKETKKKEYSASTSSGFGKHMEKAFAEL